MSTSKKASRVQPGSIAWTISRRLGMVIVLALAFLLSAIVTIYTLFRSGDTQVPNLVGRSEAEAQKLAEQAGLRVKIQRRTDSSIPANSVIETRPGPNSSVKKDSVLTIVVSSGTVQSKSELRLSVSGSYRFTMEHARVAPCARPSSANENYFPRGAATEGHPYMLTVVRAVLLETANQKLETVSCVL